VILGVTDTHAAIWYLTNDPRLSPSAGAVFTQAAAIQDQIVLSSISLIEVVYLEERGRIPMGTRAIMEALLSGTDPLLFEVPVDRRIAAAMSRVERSLVPDMPDRIIAATALFLNVPVISRDGRIRSSGIATIW